MLTETQEAYLAKFADDAIAEQEAAQQRNEEIDYQTGLNAAKQEKLVELQAQANELITSGLDEFERNYKPLDVQAETLSEETIK